jgi:hypothetical protein
MSTRPLPAARQPECGVTAQTGVGDAVGVALGDSVIVGVCVAVLVGVDVAVSVGAAEAQPFVNRTDTVAERQFAMAMSSQPSPSRS